MNRKSVTSKRISSIGYENSTLEVEFRNRSIYQFSPVPEMIYLSFLNAPSKGSFLSTQIEGNYFYRRVC
ncbi:MAG TPA: KTSC domain-containing protein [Leptospiraceae bacterium]|nr:KTSC domain-containing protein [Leptospiraceae bacterium]HMZ57325.1 KTSC domain-containing protein [Leptospiraceae bacterium]HNF17397.1 KTSC domain-containing protein [Leptospiraceae bacterium]HNF23941.1 KTSC domain-containing protein [Leptospiraceae bacterium]HNH07523.1 KTSC domain-containing protein [Leptospiraceae bacterium]